MREIKFRAWDRKKRQFDTCRNGSGISFSLNDKGVHALCSEPFKLYSQFTGIKDRTGREIYEGDIICETSCPDEHHVMGKVSYCITPDCMYAGQYMIENADGYATDWEGAEPENWGAFEVMGNIYENPELLK